MTLPAVHNAGCWQTSHTSHVIIVPYMPYNRTSLVRSSLLLEVPMTHAVVTMTEEQAPVAIGGLEPEKEPYFN